jgi:hypothetical protein
MRAPVHALPETPSPAAACVDSHEFGMPATIVGLHGIVTMCLN